MKQSRQEYLQELAIALRTEYQFEFLIEFRPGVGWYAMADEPRHFHDDGEYLGRDWREAEKQLRWLLG